MTKSRILIEDHNPTWALTFHQLQSVYQLYLGNLIVDIQHVGSTSNYGLAAKPIIDIDLVIDDRNKLNSIIQKLALLGYEHLGNLGITDRDAFKRKSDETPQDGSSRAWPKHNLYVCPSDSISLQNHVAFRDFLRNNPGIAQEYGDLKKRLIQENPYDLELNVESKTPFITSILKELGFEDSSIKSIIQENKASK